MENTLIKRKPIFSKLWFFLIFLFLVILAAVAFTTYYINSAIAAPSNQNNEKIFVIKEGQSIVEIAESLKKEGLIRDTLAFRLYARFACKGVTLSNPTTLLKKYPQEDCLSGNIQAGTFKLSTNMDLSTLAEKLTKGRVDSWTKIVEGLRNEEVAAVLAKNYGIKEEDFLKVAQLGYMFPDTYLFKVNSTAEELAQKLRSTFDQKFTSELQQQALAQGLTLPEVVTLASIIERETRDNGEERQVVAGMLIKRLHEGWKIEADATVQFALGYDEVGKTWWKKSLTAEDLQKNSPYNTRRFAGLPPGPICNPGLAALEAVAQPQDSEYYFYLHDNDGKIHYARTLAEHNTNKAKFLQ